MFMLVYTFLGIVSARHDNSFAFPNNLPWMYDPNDPTVDSPSFVALEWPTDGRLLWVAQRSPTTQIVSFSPDRIAIDRRKLTTGFVNGSMTSLTLYQRTCRVASTADACYNEPFDGDTPGTLDKSYTFYRTASMGGYIGFQKKDLDVLAGRLNLSQEQVLATDGWMGPQLNYYYYSLSSMTEHKCNNHRHVRADTLNALLPYMNPNVAWNDVFWNDAEHAEEILNVSNGSCRWKLATRTENEHFMQEVAPYPGQFHPHTNRELGDTLLARSKMWFFQFGSFTYSYVYYSFGPDGFEFDKGAEIASHFDHHVEVCALEGDCKPTDSTCVNVFTLQMKYGEDPEKIGTGDAYYHKIMQVPSIGAGDLLSLRATPATGPHAPCPVGKDGRQVPCTLATNGNIPHGFESPTQITFHVDDIRIHALKKVADDSFSMKLSYYIAWSDRFAVHPCKISLFEFGKGVSAGGKTVDAADWWKPDPDTGSAYDLSFKHEQMLQVLHTPGSPVNTPCTRTSCPWPKQLFLGEMISVDLTETASWDLFKYPFDKQVVRARINILHVDKFANPYDYKAALVDITFPDSDELAKKLKELYAGSDWTVYHAAIEQGSDGPKQISFILKIQRNARGTIYKCLIPMIANFLVVTLAAQMNSATRLKILVVSLLAAATMLNPASVGLPSNVQGVPFIQSLVIIHMIVTFCLLLYSLWVAWVGYLYKMRIKKEELEYDASTKSVWKNQSQVYKQWCDKVFVEGGDKAASEGNVLQEGIRNRAANGKVDASASHVAQEPTAQSVPISRSLAAENAAADNSAIEAEPHEPAFDVQRGILEAILMLPALFHRQDPAQPPKIWTPFGWPQAHILPSYTKLLKMQKKIDHALIKIIPCMFICAWAFDVVIYFVIPPSEPN